MAHLGEDSPPKIPTLAGGTLYTYYSHIGGFLKKTRTIIVLRLSFNSSTNLSFQYLQNAVYRKPQNGHFRPFWTFSVKLLGHCGYQDER